MKIHHLLCALLLCALPLRAALELPPYFADHMVLQRDRPIPVWGRAEPGSSVTVEFAGQKRQAKTAPDGRWRVQFDPLPASEEGREMTILCEGQTQTVGEDRKQIKDILVGEVVTVVAQGGYQHFFGWGFDGWKAALATISTNRLVRQFRVAETAAEEPYENLKGRWLSGGQLVDCRTYAYYVGARLHERLKVPVATLATIHAKARLASWCSPDGYQGIPELAEEAALVASRNSASEQFAAAFEDYVKELQAWKQETLRRSAQGRPVKRPPKIKPAFAMARDIKGNVLPNEPTATWNSMLAPLRAHPVRAWIFLSDTPGLEQNPKAKPYLTALLQSWKPAPGAPSFATFIAPHAKAKTAAERSALAADALLEHLEKGTSK
ncbi:MAG: hypothetical protein SPK06_00865 [Kiritimatiellia bacterium]|nr:hypothetical protein [Kiritimatiellia bacterium]